VWVALQSLSTFASKLFFFGDKQTVVTIALK
jgi:hypothetical protein